MTKNLHLSFALFTAMNLANLHQTMAQSNLLPGFISQSSSYTFLDDELFDELPKASKALSSNSFTHDELAINTNRLTVKASKHYIDFNSESPVEFSASADWATDYIWRFGDGSVASGIQNATHKFKEPGVYKVTVTASNENQIQNETIEIKVIDNQKGIKLEEMGHFVVFPTNNKLEANIQLDLPTREKKLYLELQDIAGNQVVEQLVGKVRRKQKIKVDMGEIPEGKYYTIIKGKKFSMISHITVIRN